mmetsp:Transcript_1022/g.4568  ORF Transcript_1022/g.4568 Transcript_1022/m.4568 type:complete len:210 (+) Transcript_1022:2526-3155(+)
MPCASKLRPVPLCTASTKLIIRDWNCSVLASLALSSRTASCVCDCTSRSRITSLRSNRRSRLSCSTSLVMPPYAPSSSPSYPLPGTCGVAAAAVLDALDPIVFFALWRRDFGVFLLGPRRVVPAQIGEQLGLTLLEALDAELEPVAVALAEAVVVELAYEGGKVGVLERPRQLRRLQQVGLPDGERAALRGPGDDVVAAGIADEVPRFP